MRGKAPALKRCAILQKRRAVQHAAVDLDNSEARQEKLAEVRFCDGQQVFSVYRVERQQQREQHYGQKDRREHS